LVLKGFNDLLTIDPILCGEWEYEKMYRCALTKLPQIPANMLGGNANAIIVGRQ